MARKNNSPFNHSYQRVKLLEHGPVRSRPYLRRRMFVNGEAVEKWDRTELDQAQDDKRLRESLKEVWE